MTNFDARVAEFLAQKRIAVAGVSRQNSGHPVGNLIYHWLKDTGHDVFPDPARLDAPVAGRRVKRVACRCHRCTNHHISVIAGACPMMFGRGVDFGHACIRGILRLTHSLPV
jgi:hypothetical protein